MKNLWISLRLILWMTFVTGVLYPLIIWGFAQLTAKQKANGDFISVNGKIIGAKLIGQKFTESQYFWGRPSAIDYNPIPSGGSNLGPTSAALKKKVEERMNILLKAHQITSSLLVPRELLFASGSGLDPHLSVDAANFQIDRILKASNSGSINKQMIENLITEHTESRRLGFIGEPTVNIILLNLALNTLYQQHIHQ